MPGLVPGIHISGTAIASEAHKRWLRGAGSYTPSRSNAALSRPT